MAAPSTSSRVTREGGVTTIDIDTTQPIEEQLADPEVIEAVRGAVEDMTAEEEPITDAPTAPQLSRYQSPSVAIARWLGTRLHERLQVIEGGIWDDAGNSWNGVRVVTAADLIGIFAEPLPEPSAFSSEARSGGQVVVWTHCPNCGIANPIKVDIGAEFKLTDEAVAKLKPTFKVDAKDHRCGQQVLPLTQETVAGQTEAFPDPEPAAAPERTTPIPVVPVEDVIKLLHRLDREELLDDERVGIPPDEDIATWAPDDLGLAYEYAWSVVHQEPERPPVPRVLRRVEPEADALPDGEPVGCTHEGEGLPDCPVCHRTPDGATEGTGDPDGDLLP